MINERFRKMAEELVYKSGSSAEMVIVTAAALQSVEDEYEKKIEALKQLHSENADAWNKEIERLKAELAEYKDEVHGDKPAPSYCIECNADTHDVCLCKKCLTGDAVKDNLV